MESAKKYEDELDKTEVVDRDRVEAALTEKLHLAQKCAQELKGRTSALLYFAEGMASELLQGSSLVWANLHSSCKRC